MCEINVYDHADVLNQTVVSRQLKMCQMMKNSFHTFSCNTYPYAELSSFKAPDKEIIALLRPGFTAAWSSGIGRDEPRRSAQNVMENTTCKGTSGCFSVDCASQSVKPGAGCGGAHICHKYHELYSWRKYCHVEKFGLSIKNLNNLWSFIKVYAVFVPNLCGEKSAWRKSVWRKNVKYKV